MPPDPVRGETATTSARLDQPRRQRRAAQQPSAISRRDSSGPVPGHSRSIRSGAGRMAATSSSSSFGACPAELSRWPWRLARRLSYAEVPTMGVARKKKSVTPCPSEPPPFRTAPHTHRQRQLRQRQLACLLACIPAVPECQCPLTLLPFVAYWHCSGDDGAPSASPSDDDDDLDRQQEASVGIGWKPMSFRMYVL
jgi:hypothetical protein